MSCLMNYRPEELPEFQSPLIEARARVEREQISALHERCAGGGAAMLCNSAAWHWADCALCLLAKGKAGCTRVTLPLDLTCLSAARNARRQAVQQHQRRAACAAAGGQPGGHAVGRLHGQLALLQRDGEPAGKVRIAVYRQAKWKCSTTVCKCTDPVAAALAQPRLLPIIQSTAQCIVRPSSTLHPRWRAKQCRSWCHAQTWPIMCYRPAPATTLFPRRTPSSCRPCR